MYRKQQRADKLEMRNEVARSCVRRIGRLSTQ